MLQICIPVKVVFKPIDARGCSLWRSLLERLHPAPEIRVRNPFGVMVRTRGGLHQHKTGATGL